MYFRSVLLFLFSFSLALPVGVFGDDSPPVVPPPTTAGTVSTQKYAFDFDATSSLDATTQGQPAYPAGHPDSLPQYGVNGNAYPNVNGNGGMIASPYPVANNACCQPFVNYDPCAPQVVYENPCCPPQYAYGNPVAGNYQYTPGYAYGYPDAYNQNYLGYVNNNYYGAYDVPCNNNILANLVNGLFSNRQFNQYEGIASCPKTSSTPCNIVPCYDEEGLLPGYMKRFGRQWFVDGWVQAGYMNAPEWPADKSNNPMRYTDRVNEGVLNQVYIAFGREVDRRSCSIDIGGRIDVLYGADYLWTSALGLETSRYDSFGNTAMHPRFAEQNWNKNDGKIRADNLDASNYGVSLPQAYLELFVPFACGFTAKAGHFYSPMSYESAMAPNNFFYSHSYTFMYGEPTTLSGVLMTQKLNSRLSVTAGVTHGWDQWENPNGRASYLAGVHWESSNARTTFDFHVMSGKPEMRDGNRTNYSMIFAHKITPRLRYALQHNLGIGENGAQGVHDLISDNIDYVDSKWYSVAQYLYYDCSETFSIGFRGEWFKDENNARIKNTAGRYEIFGTPFLETQGSNYYQISLGANWRPAQYVTIRPEVRWDWSDVKLTDGTTTTYSYNNDIDKSILTVGLDAIIKF